MNVGQMISVTNENMGFKLGDVIDCRHCGGYHDIKYGNRVLDDGTKEPSSFLAFYRCGKKTYLAGINGRRINFRSL